MVNAKKMEKLPEGWNSVKLEEVGDINMGQSPPSTEINEKEIGVPFLQGNAEFTNKYPVPQKWIKKPLKLSKKGDILISIRAPVGAINKADRPYCIGRGLAAISFKAIDEKFGWFGLIYWKHQLENLSQGSTFEAVSKNDLNNLLLLIPISLLEQRKIAEILETVDNSIEKTDKIIEKYKRIKQGLMQVLLTKGIVESDELGVMSYEAKNKSFELEGKKWEIRNEKKHKFKDSPLGRIPEEWEVVELGNIFDINPEKVNYSTTPQIRYIDIESVTEGKILNYKKFSLWNAPSRARRLVREGDIIISTVRPNLKAFGMITKQFDNYVCSTGFAVLRSKNNRILPNFMFYVSFFDKFFLKQVLPLIVGSNYPAINSFDLYKILIPLPPLPEQERIISILSQIDETIEKEQKYKAKLERIKQGLMEDLLTGKVRVEV